LHDDKLVAAEARNRIGVSHACPQTLRDGFQQLIAYGMPECVVDFLEAIQVQRQQCQTAPAFLNGGNSLFQAIPEQGAIG
jgi:hypothetical protein